MGVPAVTGAGDARDRRRGRRGARRRRRCCARATGIAIDGTTGSITTDDVPLVEPEVERRVRHRPDVGRRAAPLGVRTNADTPEDAARRASSAPRASACAAPSTCSSARTATPKMVRVILADDDEERRAALDELLPLQQADFEGIFEAMEGLPVTIRLLDPPLHEFLPDPDDLPEGAAARPRAVAAGGQPDARHARRAGSGSCYPEIYEMQVEAIFARGQGGARARADAARRGHDPARRLRARARAAARADRARRRARRAGAPGATTRSGR